MDTGLGDFIKNRRIALGYDSQAGFARHADIPSAHMNQIESGKIALPNADTRRKIAKALGVSHLRLLVAAGELTPGEANLSGESRPNASDRLAPILDRYDWSDEDLDQIARAVQAIVELKRGTHS